MNMNRAQERSADLFFAAKGRYEFAAWLEEVDAMVRGTVDLTQDNSALCAACDAFDEGISPAEFADMVPL